MLMPPFLMTYHAQASARGAERHCTRLHVSCRGARVTSDSWGTSSATYDAYAYDVDLFAWYFQGFLPVYAAGNFGYEEIDSTISSPAVAKNCLAVGNCTSSSVYLV